MACLNKIGALKQDILNEILFLRPDFDLLNVTQ
jgi:hypothetical protein